MMPFVLEAEAPGSKARAARFTTLHGEVTTPTFMPVGTQATVKGMTPDELAAIGSQVLLANTYHLLLRPGAEVFETFGGIHKFMSWERAVLTDSGGFQIFSLPNARRMAEDGAEFTSYVDGKKILLTPERSIAMQRSIGSDIMMVLDECVPSTSDRAEAERAMHLTHRWALRSLAAREGSASALFAIVQGACFEELRRDSARFLTQHPFDGFAIGGLAVGESKAEREHFTGYATDFLPKDRPRYLMGVGTPIDLLEAVHRGVDMFDCILPQAHAQHGTAYTHTGTVKLRRTFYRMDEQAIDARCSCYTCAKFSRGYIHHLFKAGEGLGWRLIARHNLHFFQELTREMRAEILAGSFAGYHAAKRSALVLGDTEVEVHTPRLKRSETLGDFVVSRNVAGQARIKQTSSGETMHPTGAPNAEATQLYVDQALVMPRLAEAELCIWDVGLGAAHNAMAAIAAVEAAAKAGASLQPLRIVSFERDLDALKLALTHVGSFEHLQHAAPSALLRDALWRSKCAPITWELHAGDFPGTMRETETRPDVIWFDPFSAKADAGLWTVEAFRVLREAAGERCVSLHTYSSSTAVRAVMLAGGWMVLSAPGAGTREESTIAATAAAVPRLERFGGIELLGKTWLERWERSGVRAHEVEVRGHPQFIRQR